MTKGDIEFSYKQSMSLADEVEMIATSMKNLSNEKMGNTLIGINANWKGENASAYLAKGVALQSKVTTTAAELHSIAQSIRTIAKRWYDIEMANLAIAEQRTY